MIRKMQLTSENLCYGPMPGPDEEIEQRLTILSDGRVWLSRYCYGSGYPYLLKSKEVKKIGKEDAEKILSAVEQYFFSPECILPFATDIGSWDLQLTSEEGITVSFHGSLCRTEEIEALNISGMIRDALGDQKLFAFDGADYDESDPEDEEGVDYGLEYRRQTGKDLETGEFIIQ